MWFTFTCELHSCDSSLFVQKEWRQFKQKNPPLIVGVISLKKLINFLLQNNFILLDLKSLKSK